jgi:hypothetical protein
MSDHGRSSGTALERTARAYRRFASLEARGRSPLYEGLAEGIAEDGDVLAFLLTLPRPKRQPNLLFAAVRHRLGTPADWLDFRHRLLADQDAVREVMLARSTQTNEPARCAVLLPLLAALPQPLALIEVGASAGLCLLPDLYGYDYGRARLMPQRSSTSMPVFVCDVRGAVPLPSALPQIAWRAGLDLNPLNAHQTGDREWLEALVWPEQTERLVRLRQALAIAAEARPRIVTGDLRSDLAELVAEAPLGATRVIFHTAVLAYVAEPVEREAFAAEAMRLGDCWIANEVPAAIPALASFAEEATGRFLLSVGGKPTAWTDAHGAALDWIASP